MSLDIIGRPVKYLYEDQSSFTDFKYLFDGVDDSVQYENIDYNGGNTTISMWVNLSSKDATQLFLWSSSSTNTALFFNGADLFIAGATLSGVLEAGGIPLDEDVQITLTINNGVCNCYINGVLSSGSPVVTNVTEFDPVNTLEIGGGFVNNMEGIYDQFVVYGRVLSQNEIAQLYNNGEKVNTNFLRTIQGFVFLSLNREIEEAYGTYDSITINGAPEVINYSSKGLFQTSDVLSSWNAIGGDLPVRYKIQSDLYPTNTVDTVYSITSAASFFGDTVFTTSASHGYVKGDYVTISDSTVEEYNGIHRITDVISVTSFSISVLFSGTSTANAIKYYNLYNVVLNVYGGLPDYHVLSSGSPMQLVGSVSISPNELNIADLDITSIVKTFIRTDNDIFSGYAPLDYNSFTSFYIEYAESYQQSNGSQLSVYTSSFEKDTLASCVGNDELFTNPDFSSGLTGWTQIAIGQAWTVSGTDLVANRPDPATTSTNKLQQPVSLIAGATYTITIIIPEDNNSDYRVFAEGFMINNTIASGLTKGINTITYVASSDAINTISLVGYYQATGESYDGNCKISSFSVVSNDCTTYLWGANSVQQFQYYLGGNMGEYLVTPNNIAKFLTDFETLVYFRGKSFTVSSILSNDAFTNSYLGDNLYVRITSDDSYVDRKIKNINDGVYQIGNQFDGDLFDSMLTELETILGKTVVTGEIELYSVPANKFLSANNGNHNTTIDSAGNPPSDWGITITPYAAPSDRLIGSGYNYTSILSNPSNEGYGSGIFQFSSPEALVGFNRICDFTDTVTLEANKEYTLSFYFRDQATTGHDPRLDDVSYPLMLPNGSFTGVTSSSGFPVSVEGDDTWYKNSIVFNTLGVTSFTFSLFLFMSEELSGGTGGSFAIDNIELLGPYEQLTEKKPIRVDEKCSNQDIHLTWLNSLGGWEFFNFQSIKDYKVSSSGEVIKRDVFNNWDTEFITGNTENDYSSVRANKVTTVRSQLVTEAEADAIWNIKTAIKVQVVNDNNTLTTVLVDKGSFTKYKDRDKLYAIEFNITYPDTQIQNQ